jgi:DNA-binding NarL/FixJ family response regulator
MRPDARLLVIGPNRFRKAAGRALPRCQRVDTGQPLSAVWQAGQQPFEGVLLSLSASRKPTRVIQSLRQVAPATRIVVACAPTAEPNAREALQAGADAAVGRTCDDGFRRELRCGGDSAAPRDGRNRV